MSKVRKAVIAAAGYGTRFLPQTKAMPKEMLPIVDKPAIQYIVEYLVEAGIKDIIIVTGYSKRSIEDHFDTPNEELLNNLRLSGPSKAHYIDEMQKLTDMANFAYVRQKGPYGPATPMMSAAHLIGDEPFIYTYADDFIVAQPNFYQQMINLYEELGGGVLPCIQVSDAEITRYGIVGGDEIRPGVMKASSIIEKPTREQAPSNFAHVAAYLFGPNVLPYIDKGRKALPEGKEFWVTDSIVQPMLDDGQPFYACAIQNSVRYDTGTPMGYLKTVVEFALQRDDFGEEFKNFLREKLQ